MKQEQKKQESQQQQAPVIIKSDFRSDVEVVDVITFANEFLQRYPGKEQKDVLIAINGNKAGEWSTQYSEIALEVGMKGGKNWVLEIDAAFTMYFINCLRNPHEYFSKITKRLLPYTVDKTFDIINVSVVNEDQARRAFFDSVKRALKLTRDPKTGDNWFERYVGLDLREQAGDLKKKDIEFPTSQAGAGGIRVMSFNSDASAPEGLHMLKFYADELSRADTKAKYAVAKNLYDLGLSNTSVSFPSRVGKTIGWAYPNDTDYDLAHERYEKSLSSSTGAIYGRRLTTFQFNPSITKEHLKDRYDADPLEARRKFECVKPLSKDNFYQPYPEKLGEVISDKIINKIKYKVYPNQRETKDGKIHKLTDIEILGLLGDKRERCFFYDASKSKDRFWLAGGYNETIDAKKLSLFVGDEVEVINTNKIPVVDILVCIEPIQGRPIDYVNMGKLFTTMIKYFPNTRSINSDHYQNESFRQSILAQGVNAETYFFSNAMQLRLYTVKRAQVWNNNLIIAKDIEASHRVRLGSHEIQIHELWKYEGEKLIKQGNKIDHPENGCFTGDTRVALIDGTNLTFEELFEIYGEDKPFYVYSINADGICVGVGRNPRITKKVTELTEILLDNFTTITCTKDHLFMTLDREWIKAEKLTTEISIMPLYRKVSNLGGWNGYERVYDPIKKTRLMTHQIVAKQFLGEIKGKIVHHRDHNKRNNLPENLELLNHKTHCSYHTYERHQNDREYVKKLREGHKQYRENGGNEKSRENVYKLFEAGKLKKGPETCQIEDCNKKHYAFNMCEMHYKRVQRRKIKGEKVNHKNHKIISIRTINKEVDVWDITVEKYHNFALASGVFVHNSKDGQDVVAGLVYDLMQLEAEGVVGMASSLEMLNDEQLRQLAERYIDRHYTLAEAETPGQQILSILKSELGLNEKDLIKLAKFVKEEYQYP